MGGKDSHVGELQDVYGIYVLCGICGCVCVWMGEEEDV